MSLTFIEKFKAARQVSTPLIYISTPDPGATIAAILHSYEGPNVPPMLSHDVVRGLLGVNKAGAAAASKLLGEVKPRALADPVKMMTAIADLDEHCIVFSMNLQRFVKDIDVVQAIWNLRDAFKSSHRTLIGIGHGITLPTEIAQDVLVIDEPFPGREALAKIIRENYAHAQEKYKDLKSPSDATIEAAVDAVSGLAAFPAEQASAECLRKTGLSIDDLWERKRQQIEQTPGLSVWRGAETYDDVVGIENAKRYFELRGKGPDRRKLLVFIDEIDKHVANFGASGTGDTTTEMMAPLLTAMQDKRYEASLLLGVPGVGKTLLAKSIANLWGVPNVCMDFSGMKASHVGESGQNIRNALKIIQAVSQGDVFLVATCNDVSNLPAEFRSRFKNGTFFFDFPTAEERDPAWMLYIKKYGLDFRAAKRPDDEGWTAREIDACCYQARVLNCSLGDAAKFITPASISNKETLEALRRSANGRYISASKPGLYKMPEAPLPTAGRKGRAFAQETDA